MIRLATPVFGTLLLILLAPLQAAETPLAANVPGGVAILPLHGPGMPEVYFGDSRVLVTEGEDGWLAVVGVPLSMKPGEHWLKVNWPEGSNMEAGFDITSKQYRTQHLTIPDKRKVNPNAEDLKRIREEQAIARRVRATWTERVPDLAFEPPVTGRFSGSFGLRRFINEQPRSPHRGMDIAAPEGTPVRAPAAGIVRHVGDFFFSGNVIYLDHGRGLITLYAHLSRIDVKVGQEIAKGEIIGAVGKTGRVTGPHLHWSIYLNRTAVDPALFIPERALASGEAKPGS